MIRTQRKLANYGLPSAQIIHAKYARENASGAEAIQTMPNLYGTVEKIVNPICNGSAELHAIAARPPKKPCNARRRIKPRSEWPELKSNPPGANATTKQRLRG
jgi:hypothetical protein